MPSRAPSPTAAGTATPGAARAGIVLAARPAALAVAMLAAFVAAMPAAFFVASPAGLFVASPAAFFVASLLAATARAGGGPESVFLVVNASSPDSIAVANAFAAVREVPPINVLMLPWQGGTETATLAEFRGELLLPVLRTIEARRLTPQIDCIAYSSDFPWRIDFTAEMPAELLKQDAFKFASGSLTGMTMLHNALQAGAGPVWLDPKSNFYFRPPGADGVPATVGFRSWYGWAPDGTLLETGGNRYLLATMLGVTAGRGNTVAEIVRGLEASAAADGTCPAGTIYYVTNKDVRSTTRSPAFPPIVRALEALGVEAEIVEGALPAGKRDVAGLTTGIANFNWPASGCAVVPGAICENLTSFGAVFTPAAPQTPLSDFIRAGAAGSSGTITEPYALQAKFPHPSIHLHYARGATLAEAFYQSVQSPYQLLVVGDPLCRPWAGIPVIEVFAAGAAAPLAAGAELSGVVELEPREATAAAPTAAPTSAPFSGLRGRPAARKPPRPSAAVDRFALFVDGVRLAQCGPGERLPLDTTTLADGHHELRVVGTESSPVESQGRWIAPVRFANHGRTLTLTAEPVRVPLSGAVRVTVAGEGVESVAVFAMGRVLGRTNGDATIEVPAELLGRGRVTIRATGRATGRAGTGPADGVNADPIVVEVTEK